MKTISDYTIYCTEAQTHKALNLGVPIEKLSNHPIDKKICDKYHFLVIDGVCYNNPTTEQMIRWLEEQKSITIEVSCQYGINKYCYYIFDNYGNDIENIESKIRFSSRKEAILAAIDTALKYLDNNENELNKLAQEEANLYGMCFLDSGIATSRNRKCGFFDGFKAGYNKALKNDKK